MSKKPGNRRARKTESVRLYFIPEHMQEIRDHAARELLDDDPSGWLSLKIRQILQDLREEGKRK
jgi:hypothetical protein